MAGHEHHEHSVEGFSGGRMAFVNASVLLVLSVFLLVEAYKRFRAPEDIDGVVNVHHVHAWRSDEKSVYLEGHVDVRDMRVSETSIICREIETILFDRFGITHSTIQFEVDCCTDKEIVRI